MALNYILEHIDIPLEFLLLKRATPEQVAISNTFEKGEIFVLVRKTVYVQFLDFLAVAESKMAIFKIGLCLRNRCPWSEKKLIFDPKGRKRVYVQLLLLLQIAKLNGHIWHF